MLFRLYHINSYMSISFRGLVTLIQLINLSMVKLVLLLYVLNSYLMSSIICRSRSSLIYSQVVGIKSNTIPKPNISAIPFSVGTNTPVLYNIKAPP